MWWLIHLMSSQWVKHETNKLTNVLPALNLMWRLIHLMSSQWVKHVPVPWFFHYMLVLRLMCILRMIESLVGYLTYRYMSLAQENSWHYAQQLVSPQGPKLRLPGRQCDQKVSSGDQNFIAGCQLATCKAGCYCRLSCSEKMIKNWNLEALCQQVSYFLSCWYFFNLKVKRIFL